MAGNSGRALSPIFKPSPPLLLFYRKQDGESSNLGKREKRSSPRTYPFLRETRMSPTEWIRRYLLILGLGGVWANEISFVPASGKLEFVQEGIVFNPRQQAALVFQFSLGPELRALSEITHLV